MRNDTLHNTAFNERFQLCQRYGSLAIHIGILIVACLFYSYISFVRYIPIEAATLFGGATGANTTGKIQSVN